MKRRIKIILALVLVLILGYIFLLPHGGHRRKLEAYKQQLIAKGEKLTIAELAPPASSSNAVSAGHAFTNLMSGYKSPPNYPSKMIIVAPGVAMVGYSNIEPSLMTNYEQNIRLAAELRSNLNVSVLDFSLDYSRSFLIPLNHLALLKMAERLFSDTVMQSFFVEDFPEARLNLYAAVDLLRVTGNDKLELSVLVRMANAFVAIAATWEGLQSDQWSEQQLSELQSKWQSMDLFGPTEGALGMERAVAIEMLTIGRTSYNRLDGPGPGLFDSSGTSASIAKRLRDGLKELYDRYPRYWAWKNSWSFEEEHYYLQVLQAALEASRHVEKSDSFLPAFNELKVQMTNINQLHPDGGKHFWVLGDQDDHIGHILSAPARAEVTRRLLVVAIALKRFHLQHGTHPDTLSGLVPQYLSQVPVDFMDGKPLRYKLRPDGGFLLYSVGEDGEDGGGDATFASSVTTKSWMLARDIVWPRPATAQEVADYLKGPQISTNAPANR